jgi:hypothetical protein
VSPALYRIGRGLLYAGTGLAIIAIFVGDFSTIGRRILYGIAFACLFASFALSFFKRA